MSSFCNTWLTEQDGMNKATFSQGLALTQPSLWAEAFWGHEVLCGSLSLGARQTWIQMLV